MQEDVETYEEAVRKQVALAKQTKLKEQATKEQESKAKSIKDKQQPQLLQPIDQPTILQLAYCLQKWNLMTGDDTLCRVCRVYYFLFLLSAQNRSLM